MFASEEDPVVGVGKALPVPLPVVAEVVGEGLEGAPLSVLLLVAAAEDTEPEDVGPEDVPLIVLLVAAPLPPGGGGGTTVPLLDPVVLFPAPEV